MNRLLSGREWRNHRRSRKNSLERLHARSLGGNVPALDNAFHLSFHRIEIRGRGGGVGRVLGVGSDLGVGVVRGVPVGVGVGVDVGHGVAGEVGGAVAAAVAVPVGTGSPVAVGVAI